MHERALLEYPSNLKLVEETQQYTGCDGRTHNASDVGTHGVLQQIVGLVVFKSYDVGHTSRVGHCANTCVTDKRVDLVVAL